MNKEYTGNLCHDTVFCTSIKGNNYAANRIAVKVTQTEFYDLIQMGDASVTFAGKKGQKVEVVGRLVTKMVATRAGGEKCVGTIYAESVVAA